MELEGRRYKFSIRRLHRAAITRTGMSLSLVGEFLLFQTNAGTVRSQGCCVVYLSTRSGLGRAKMTQSRGMTRCLRISLSLLTARAVGTDSIWEMSAMTSHRNLLRFPTAKADQTLIDRVVAVTNQEQENLADV